MQDRLVDVVVALPLVRLHPASAGRREVAVAINALHRRFRLDERRASQLRDNRLSHHHVDQRALAGCRVFLGMVTGQMLKVLIASSGVQAALRVACEARI